MAEEEEVVGATCAHHLNLYRTGPDRRSLSEARRKEARVFGEVVNGSNVAGLHSLERELLGDFSLSLSLSLSLFLSLSLSSLSH